MVLKTFCPQVMMSVVVGFTSNLVLYLVNLALNSIELILKIAMSILYFIGGLQTFVLIRNGLSDTMGTKW